jgi:muconate cycloisomerase
MRITSGQLYQLQIPFNESFAHSTKERTFSDALVLCLKTDTGIKGFGEGLPRPYVTGETVSSAMTHIQETLWPKICAHHFEPLQSLDDLSQFDRALGEPDGGATIAPNAARCAAEIALVDCSLRAQNKGLGEFLVPLRESVEYAGVIPAGEPERAARHAEKMTMLGLKHLKIKVASGDDLARIRSVMGVIGAETGIRLDANAAWNLADAEKAIPGFEQFPILAIEAPITRSTTEDLVSYKKKTTMPVCVDEYLVTIEDAKQLIESKACDIFNLRVSKLGGIWRTWHIAQMALRAGLKLQVGAQVGETAILSAVGRHLLAALPDVLFAEGSAGCFLLTEDVAQEAIEFGMGGVAPILSGPGLGITVQPDVLEKYAVSVTNLVT